jgi:hypothetical protein
MKKRYKCNKCGEKFIYKFNFRNHKKKHEKWNFGKRLIWAEIGVLVCSFIIYEDLYLGTEIWRYLLGFGFLIKLLLGIE